MENQAVSAWLNRQYKEISHGAINGPPGPMLSFWSWEVCNAAHLQHQASDYLQCNSNHNRNIKSNIVSFSSEVKFDNSSGVSLASSAQRQV